MKKLIEQKAVVDSLLKQVGYKTKILFQRHNRGSTHSTSFFLHGGVDGNTLEKQKAFLQKIFDRESKNNNTIKKYDDTFIVWSYIKDDEFYIKDAESYKIVII